MADDFAVLTVTVVESMLNDIQFQNEQQIYLICVNAYEISDSTSRLGFTGFKKHQPAESLKRYQIISYACFVSAIIVFFFESFAVIDLLFFCKLKFSDFGLDGSFSGFILKVIDKFESIKKKN